MEQPKTPDNSSNSSEKSKNIGMDKYNEEALRVLETQGTQEFMKHVFTDQDNPKRQLSYAEMRMRYG